MRNARRDGCHDPGRHAVGNAAHHEPAPERFGGVLTRGVVARVLGDEHAVGPLCRDPCLRCFMARALAGEKMAGTRGRSLLPGSRPSSALEAPSGRTPMPPTHGPAAATARPGRLVDIHVPQERQEIRRHPADNQPVSLDLLHRRFDGRVRRVHPQLRAVRPPSPPRTRTCCRARRVHPSVPPWAFCPVPHTTRCRSSTGRRE